MLKYPTFSNIQQLTRQLKTEKKLQIVFSFIVSVQALPIISKSTVYSNAEFLCTFDFKKLELISDKLVR